MEQISCFRYELLTSSLILPMSNKKPRQITSCAVPSIHPQFSLSGGLFFPTVHTAVGPSTLPVMTVFFATFIAPASLSPNNTSIMTCLPSSSPKHPPVPLFAILFTQLTTYTAVIAALPSLKQRKKQHLLFTSVQRTGTVLMLSSVNNVAALPPFSALPCHK